VRTAAWPGSAESADDARRCSGCNYRSPSADRWGLTRPARRRRGQARERTRPTYPGRPMCRSEKTRTNQAPVTPWRHNVRTGPGTHSRTLLHLFTPPRPTTPPSPYPWLQTMNAGWGRHPRGNASATRHEQKIREARIQSRSRLHRHDSKTCG
jgi:hypothetical protein